MVIEYTIPEIEGRARFLLEIVSHWDDTYELVSVEIERCGRTSPVAIDRFERFVERHDGPLSRFWFWLDVEVWEEATRSRSDWRAACGGCGWAPEGARDAY